MFYCLVQSTNIPHFEEGCNYKLRMGWALHGTTTIALTTGNNVVYTQAFVKGN